MMNNNDLIGKLLRIILQTGVLIVSIAGVWPATSEQAPSVQTTRSEQEEKLAPVQPAVMLSDESIPALAKVYVAPIAGGFDTYLIAGLQKKKVPLVVVMDRAKAQFEITGVSETEYAGWAKMLFLGSQQSAEEASIKISNLRTGAVVFAYSVNKGNSVRGKQSAAEACAKHIRTKIVNQY
jgi:hypothetical protein